MPQNVVVKGQHARSDNPDRALFDLYPTPEDFTRALLVREEFDSPIWEPAAGRGDVALVAREFGYGVFESDIVDRRIEGQKQIDFLDSTATRGLTNRYDFVTNPPFRLLNGFIVKMLSMTRHKVACVIPLAALCGKTRFEQIYKVHMPARVYINPVYMKIEKPETGEIIQSQFYHAWVVWELGFEGRTTLEWIDPPCTGYQNPP